jgi:peroxiredoxin
MLRIPLMMAVAALASASLQAAEAPRPAPEYSITLPNGKQVLLSQYRGKVVALGFYFTTCPHCQVTCQLMEKLSGEYGGRGFRPLGVAFNEMANLLIGDYARNLKLTFPLGASSRGTVYEFLKENDNQRGTVPQMVLVDRKGIIRFQSPAAGDEVFFKEQTLRQRIEELLKEPATRAAAKKK